MTAVLQFNNQIKSFIISSDTKSTEKETTLVSLEYLHELFGTENSNLEDIIWNDGPNSEFQVVSHFLGICCCVSGRLG